MEVRSLEISLRGFGVPPGHARVDVLRLSLADRLKRAGTAMGLGLLLALIALPIPIVHFIMVPGALLLGAIVAVVRLGQRDIFRGAHGRCPFCAAEQSFTVLGRFKLPRRVYCASCQRELRLEDPTSALQHSPT